jgi:inward rectifier potassium channel
MMVTSQNERAPKSRVVRLGGREIITEGLHLNFWADISHRCMTASWPAFIGGAALVFIAFNAVFGDMHPQTLYGHLIATVELFTGIFSMSLMTGLIFARLRGRLSHSCHVNIVWETSRERAK